MIDDSLTQNINRFVDNKIIDSDLQRFLNHGENLLEELAQIEANYHKACKNKYDKYHLTKKC